MTTASAWATLLPAAETYRPEDLCRIDPHWTEACIEAFCIELFGCAVSELPRQPVAQLQQDWRVLAYERVLARNAAREVTR